MIDIRFTDSFSQHHLSSATLPENPVPEPRVPMPFRSVILHPKTRRNFEASLYFNRSSNIAHRNLT